MADKLTKARAEKIARKNVSNFHHLMKLDSTGIECTREVLEYELRVRHLQSFPAVKSAEKKFLVNGTHDLDKFFKFCADVLTKNPLPQFKVIAVYDVATLEDDYKGGFEVHEEEAYYGVLLVQINHQPQVWFVTYNYSTPTWWSQTNVEVTQKYKA